MENNSASRTASPHQDFARVRSIDYAEQHESLTHPQPHPRRTGFHWGPASIRRRAGSAQTSANPSPGPSQFGRNHYEPSRRSVAIASTSGHGDDLGGRDFSLAGLPSLDALVANQPYVDPGYAQLNPAYDQPTNVRPVWGLAKPLPRVLRPGMVPDKEELQQEELEERRELQEQSDLTADLEAGRIEPTLRPDKISTQLDILRRERELSLFRAYRRQHQDSPLLSPHGFRRRVSDAPTERPEIRLTSEDSIPEEPLEEQREPEEESADPALPQLREAIANVNQAREEEELKIPYQDAVPLPAYQAEDDEIHNLHTYWSIIRLRFREPLAELLAITIQFTLGFSSNLSMTVSHGTAGVGSTPDWAWGLAAMVAIYIAGGISGAHLNPAISLMLYVYRGFPLRKVPIYVAAQLTGAFLATLIAFGLFQPGLIASLQTRVTVEPTLLIQSPIMTVASQSVDSMLHSRTLLSNFITFPRHPWVSTTTAFLTEFVATAILSASVLALGDDTNAPPGAGMNALVVGLLVAVLGMAFGYNTGLAMNPARDFGPRVAMAALGYNNDMRLFADGYWFRVAWLGPLAGALVGGFLYDAAIFVGGESPVNYPATRVKRAASKWKKRWEARLKRSKKVIENVKDSAVGVSGYETVAS